MTLRPGWPTTFAAALAVAVLLQAVFTLDSWLNALGRPFPPLYFQSLAIVHVAMALALTVATRRADAATDAGQPPLVAYLRAVVAGTAIGALGQYALQVALDMPSSHDPIGAAPGDPAQPMRVFLEYLLWNAIGVYVYARLRSQRRAAARLQANQLEHERLRRRTVEAQLQALQARVDPLLLRDTLLQVRSRSEREPDTARYLLDELASYLRAALPAVDAPTGDLAAELAAVRSYAALRSAPHEARGAGVEVHADAAALGSRLPPMLLLPLVEALLGSGAGKLRIDAHRPGGRLEVALRYETLGADDDAAAATPAAAERAAQQLDNALSAARARLRMLYGDAAALSSATGHGTTATFVLTIDATTTDADRDPR